MITFDKVSLCHLAHCGLFDSFPDDVGRIIHTFIPHRTGYHQSCSVTGHPELGLKTTAISLPLIFCFRNWAGLRRDGSSLFTWCQLGGSVLIHVASLLPWDPHHSGVQPEFPTWQLASKRREAGQPLDVRAQRQCHPFCLILLVYQVFEQPEFRKGKLIPPLDGRGCTQTWDGVLFTPISGGTHPADNLPRCSFAILQHLLQLFIMHAFLLCVHMCSLLNDSTMACLSV